MVLGWLVLIALWSAASYVGGVPEYLLASPGRVAGYCWDNPGLIGRAVGMTASEAITGWAVAVVLGVMMGAMMYYLRWGRRLVMAPLIALQTTPIVALAPLVTYWFGYGWLSKVAVATIIATFPVVMATYSALGDTKKAYVYMYRLAGASEARVFWDVRLRSAWGGLLPSLKIAGVFAVIGSIVAEFMGGNTGLGFLIMKAVYNAKSVLLLAVIILSALLGQVLLLIIEKGVARWEERFSP